jgi:hypothetical protein
MASGGKYSPITDAENWHVGEGRPLRFNNDDGAGAAVSMTTWDVEWTLHKAKDTAAIVTKTSALGKITFSDGDGTDDLATVDTDPADTATLAPGSYYHFLRRVDNVDRSVIAFGEVQLQARGA